MDWCLLTLFLGAILSLFLPIVPEFSLLVLILCLSFALLFIKKYRYFALLSIAACWILLAANQYRQNNEHKNVNIYHQGSTTIEVIGKVSSIGHIKGEALRFNFEVHTLNGKKLANPYRIRLRWDNPLYWIQQGQTWQFLVKVKPAHGLSNLGGFNYQTWLMQQNVFATGYVKKSAKTLMINEQSTIRAMRYKKFYSLMPKHELSAIIMALGFGERGLLTSAHWQVLSATATQHLIAISGLHIGLIAVSVLLILRGLVKYFPIKWCIKQAWCQGLTQRKLTYIPIIGSCVVATYYSYLAGFSIPTLRALIMLYLYWFMRSLGINLTAPRTLLITIFMILVIWPLNILSVSFWLSISALTIIFLTTWRFPIAKIKSDKSISTLPDLANTRYRAFKEKTGLWLKSLLVLQLALTVIMLPIAGSLSYQLPLMAYFANIVAVPAMSFSTIPLTLASVILLPLSETLSLYCMTLALKTLDVIWYWLTIITSIEWAIVPVSAAKLSLILCLIWIIIFVIIYHVKWRYVLVPSLIFCGYYITFIVKSGIDNTWLVNVFDVGHGLAIVIEKNDQILVYDTGAAYPSGFNLSQVALTPYLNYRGYRSIDKVIISHNDNDHAGGLAYLREHYYIGNVMANSPHLSPQSSCLAGQNFDWQGLNFHVLSPASKQGENNDDSCVIKVTDGYHSVLLTGDISKRVERKLVQNNKLKNILISDLLIAPHHGSKSSSSGKFLSAVSPRVAIFSTGYLNQWHMPSLEIRRRYASQNIQTFNTASQGMIVVKFSQKSMKVESFREDIKPFWFINTL